MIDNDLKYKLKEFLSAKNIFQDSKTKLYRCPNHADEKPSAVLYPKGKKSDYPVLWCPVCSQSWGVFDLSGLLNNTTNFIEMKKDVMNTLNISDVEKPKEQKKQNPVSVPIEEARKIYTTSRVMELYKLSKFGRINKENAKITGSWPYHSVDENIIGMDIRFEDGESGKDVITYWYNGKFLKSAGAPVLIYNLHECLKTDKPILIVEGAKCAELIKKNLPEFCCSSWNGGSGKAHLNDWSVFSEKEIFILPDDDEPGIKAALEIKKQLTHAKIIPVIEKARELKSSGADIEEILQIMSPEELTKYILKSEEFEEPENNPAGCESSPPDLTPPFSGSSDFSEPIEFLGIASDNKAHFIDFWGYHHEERLHQLTKTKLLDMADISHWRSEFPKGNGIDWDEAVNYMIMKSKIKSFDETRLRGRGAWHDGEKISYFDGNKIYGEYDEKYRYLKSIPIDCGINDDPLDEKIIIEMTKNVFKMSFQTHADAVRALAWSALAPFAGAFSHRPAILLTGESSSGKSKVATMIFKPMMPNKGMWLNGAETTVAGVRGLNKKDSSMIVFDESEADTEKKNINRSDLFSLMRVNVTDDSPDTVKGTKDGGYISYQMSSMFCFISIEAGISKIADANRLFTIHMEQGKTGVNWKELSTNIKTLFSEKNCRAVRSYTWRKIHKIEPLAERIVEYIKEEIKRDHRSCYMDAMLLSAYLMIWKCNESPSDTEIHELVEKFYSSRPADENRSEAAEVVERLLDETIEFLHEDRREKLTIREALLRVHSNKKTVLNEYGEQVHDVEPKEIMVYRETCARAGLKVIAGNKLAIKNRYHHISKITGMCVDSYQSILSRHKQVEETSKVVHYDDGSAKRSTILKDWFIQYVPENENLKLELEG